MIIREDRKGTFRMYENADDPIEKAIGRSCSTCGEIKVRKDFVQVKSTKDGMDNRCRPCEYKRTSARHKKRRESDPAWAAEHSKITGKRSRERRLNDPIWADEQRKRTAVWTKNNPEKNTAQAQNYRAKKIGNGGEFSYDEWAQLRETFGNECPLSGRTTKIERDHFIPVSAGGINDKTNIVPLDGPLNRSKNASNPFEWIETQPAEYYPGFWKCVEYLAKQNGMTVKEYVEFVESFFSK